MVIRFSGKKEEIMIQIKGESVEVILFGRERIKPYIGLLPH